MSFIQMLGYFRIFHFTSPKKSVMFKNKVLSFSVVSGRSWLQFTSVHCGPALQSNENMPSSLIHMS